MPQVPTLSLKHATGDTRIVIEEGLIARIGPHVLDAAPAAERCMVVMDANVAALHGQHALQSLSDAGLEVIAHTVVADEAQKSLETVRHIYDAMLAARLTRSSVVLAMGGGIVGDVAGFAASTYMRGLALVQIPTTLLAMVDASIGGKTGVNLPLPRGSLGKNLIGAFLQPLRVLSDPAVLVTLNARDFRCGLAECVKHALIAAPTLLDFIEKNATAILSQRDPALVELIHRSAAVKIDIVQQDEREAGDRALLNLGHTFGHALESIKELDLRHGEAIAIGIVAAMNCAIDTQRMSSHEAQLVIDLLKKLGLPVTLSQPASVETILQVMGYDKKNIAGRLRLILPLGLGRACIVDDVPPEVVHRALIAIGARA